MHVFHQNFFYQVLLIMFRFLFSCYSHCFDILLACNISSMSHFASLPEHCQCYPREDVFPIFSLGSVREIHSLGKYFSVHSLGHSEYQEIHTFSALNIDSVKINTSLLMMREWFVHWYLYLYYLLYLRQSIGLCIGPNDDRSQGVCWRQLGYINYSHLCSSSSF